MLKRIEEDFEQAKDMGLDHNEVRSFLGKVSTLAVGLSGAGFMGTTSGTI
jgi:hypothetical protein